MLTADGILKSDDLGELVKVDVPEWGGHVFVKIMSGIERDRWEIAATNLMKAPSNANIRAGLCAVTICDEKGERLFHDTDVDALGKKSSLALDRVFGVSRKINRLTDEELDELEKNSVAALSGDSGSN